MSTGNNGDGANRVISPERPLPPPAVIPPPSLTVGVPGFPEGAIRTPGGYTIIAEGKDQAWRIYGPGQKFEEEPLSRIWGDPHVTEKDGTRWDFTKDSTFSLDDGTIIRCDTTSEVGASVSQAITIIAGNDRVDVTGIDGASPQVAKSQDGEAWMAANSAVLQNSHTFSMVSDGNKVDWIRSSNGKVDGVVTGATQNFDGKGSYDQTIGQTGDTGIDLASAVALHGHRGFGGLGQFGKSAIDWAGQAMLLLQQLDQFLVDANEEQPETERANVAKSNRRPGVPRPQTQTLTPTGSSR